MSDPPIDLAERRRRRAAQQTAADGAQPRSPASSASAAHDADATASATDDPAASETPAGNETGNETETGRYAELHCLSDFSFQRGASSAGELFERAKKLGYAALAITDECSLAGIVRAFNASRDHDLPLVIGSELHLQDGPSVVLLVENQDGYSNLCRIITRARLRSDKGEYRVCRGDLDDSSAGLFALWLPALAASAGYAAAAPPATQDTHGASAASAAATVPAATTAGKATGDSGSAQKTTSRNAGHDTQAQWLRQLFPQRCWIAVELHRDGTDAQRLAALQILAQREGFPLVAAGDVHMHRRGRRALQDVMTAIRLNTTVDQAGSALFPNGERHLRPLAALQRLYPPELLATSVAIAQRCHFRLDTVHYEYPHEVVPPGLWPIEHLRTLTWAGAVKRWPEGIEEKNRRQLQDELALIGKLKYEHFFLTVHDIVRWARAQEPPILCQGRGSAANSAVCYCLGITSIDPVRSNLLFERFISEERDEPPDIDVDFEHERREEVIQYVFGKYGRDRAALAATVIMYRRKSAARDVGRALGLGDDQLNQLSEAYSHAHGDIPLAQRLRECGFDPTSRLLRQLVALVEELRGSPRHLSQHVGGFVISEHPLHTLVPVENASMADRTVIQWDKDDLESLRLLKVDCLALGMLTCLRRCFDLLREHCDLDYNLATLPPEDGKTYTMIQQADTIGVFQIESRAQMSMLPRLKPANFYDLVVEIAIVRPGPIEGGMVHPYLRRRKGLEPIVYPESTLQNAAGNAERKNRIEAILERTHGVPIFQEQVMKLVQVVAGFTPGRADQLRRAMGSWKHDGTVEKFQKEIFDGMRQQGYEAYAEGLFNQIKGFGSYGFPESHSASFALLAYASSYIKRHHPAVFTCALLNSLPMGFYAPAQLIQDARRHDVVVRPIDVTRSHWHCTLERIDTGHALRLGLCLLKGASAALAARIDAARTTRAFVDVADLVQRAALNRFESERLAEAGALQQLAGHRHRARWYSAGAERLPPLLADAQRAELEVRLRPPSTAENVEADYATQGYSLESHPLALIRRELRRRHIGDSRRLREQPHGAQASVAGLVTVRQRPPEAGGVTFLTLEDEFGPINIVVWERVALRYRRELLESTVLRIDGQLQQVDGVCHLVAQRLQNLSRLLPQIDVSARNFH
jgi:error-prone DNA polymerase